MSKIAVGMRCQIVSVHHPVFNSSIGKHVIVASITPAGAVWAYDDKPKKYRINRNGRKVPTYTPQCIQTIYGADQLRVAKDQTRQSDTEES